MVASKAASMARQLLRGNASCNCNLLSKDCNLQRTVVVTSFYLAGGLYEIRTNRWHIQVVSWDVMAGVLGLLPVLYCRAERARHPAAEPAAEAAPQPTRRHRPAAAETGPDDVLAVDERGRRQMGSPATDRRLAAKSGVWATPAGDGKGDIPENLSSTDLYDRIAHNLYSINFVWTLVTGFLVMFMQAGFACVETGLCRAKNASHTFAMNLMIYPLGCFAFWAYGFAIGWGNWFNGPVPPGWYASLGPGWPCSTAASASNRPGRHDGSAQRLLQVGAVGHQGLLPARRRRRQRDGPVLLHDGLLRHHGHDSHRHDGRTLGVEEFLPLRPLGRVSLLPLRQLGLGWRLAGSNRPELGLWATGRSTLPARAWCTPWVASSP